MRNLKDLKMASTMEKNTDLVGISQNDYEFRKK